ncbi:hypothetical protein POLEWNIK_00080 [Brevundimonas phage vB_BpoS-Polewnik]|nr:hypothetical protein POLEWNIK_00080 [Brevundimonas phage vB_BpoS-Polewnik]
MTEAVWVAIATYSHDRHAAAVTAVADSPTLARRMLAENVALQHNPTAWLSADPVLIVVQSETKSSPAWRDLSDDDQNLLASAQIEDVHDCAKEIAHDMLDSMDAEEVQTMLQELKEDQEGVI